jgi:anti-sigma-K factor RskA
MSSALEHGECTEALAAYALGALPDPEGERVRLHLATCRECRAELEWLSAAVDALPASVTPIEPPPELKARVMQVVEAEAELLQAAGAPADRPAPGRLRPRWRPDWPLWGALALAGAAALALVLVLVTAGTATRTVRAQITGSALAAHARATVAVQGNRASLVVTGLPLPPAGHVDELWVKHGQASPQPAGVFVVRSGSIRVTRTVRRGDLVMVTVEPGRGTERPTVAPVIVARA